MQTEKNFENLCRSRRLERLSKVLEKRLKRITQFSRLKSLFKCYVIEWKMHRHQIKLRFLHFCHLPLYKLIIVMMCPWHNQKVFWSLCLFFFFFFIPPLPFSSSLLFSFLFCARLINCDGGSSEEWKMSINERTNTKRRTMKMRVEHVFVMGNKKFPWKLLLSTLPLWKMKIAENFSLRIFFDNRKMCVARFTKNFFLSFLLLAIDKDDHPLKGREALHHCHSSSLSY